MTRERIAVLGAGPMGLAAAYQLALDGHAPVVFEADDRLGGMTASFDFGGLRIERFYHFHCSSDADFLALLDELGLTGSMRWVNTKMGYYLGGRVQAWGSPGALLRFEGLSFVDKIRCGVHALVSTRRSEWSDLDGVDAREWLQGWIGRSAFDLMWKQLFDLKFHHYSGNVSAAWIWSRIRRLGRSRDALFRERLGHLDGGSQTFLDALAAAIVRAGGEIRLSTPVSRVSIDDAGVRGVVVRGELERFDRVVSTIPLPYVPSVLPDLPESLLATFRSLPYIAVVCVVVKLRRALTENFWLNISDEGMDIPGLVEYSNLNPLPAHVVYVPYYLPGDHPKFREPDPVFASRVTSYLKTISPSLTDDDVLDVHVSRYRFAQPICEPNFSTRLPPIDLPIRGLVLADTSYYYPEDRGISESIGLGRKMAKWVTSRSNSPSHGNSRSSSSPGGSPPS